MNHQGFLFPRLPSSAPSHAKPLSTLFPLPSLSLSLAPHGLFSVCPDILALRLHPARLFLGSTLSF